jgi:L-fuconolactonase
MEQPYDEATAYHEVGHAMARTLIDHFGWDRVLFASDWPVVNLGASFKVWCEAIKQIVRSDKPENQAKLFRDNAVKFYGLA